MSLLACESTTTEDPDIPAVFDKTKQGIQEIVDMPDRLIYLFLQLCLQNNDGFGRSGWVRAS